MLLGWILQSKKLSMMNQEGGPKPEGEQELQALMGQVLGGDQSLDHISMMNQMIRLETMAITELEKVLRNIAPQKMSWTLGKAP